ncbi:hypothetical protein [Flavobacterium sp. T12S277]|uniref:hypothetical protein n=1 Tax=Flavobacterium sp. T12S277 TaxID=3402752 RepID=UPI003AE57EC5
MCTVSFVNTRGIIILTSNCYEKPTRLGVIKPEKHTVEGKNIVFLKDSKTKGTCCIADEKGTVLFLLKGADMKYDVKLTYRKSRELIVLDVLNHESPKIFWNIINLEDIEPFTLVLYQDKRLFQLRWNGLKKESMELDINKNYMWSSATLDFKKNRLKQANLFTTFLEGKKDLLSSILYFFHKYTEANDEEKSSVINSNKEIKSITQMIIEKNKLIFEYYDLVENKEFSTSLIID